MLSGMSSLDYWVVIVFSIGILVAGLALSDKRANMTSFFAAGGAVPWWMSGLSLYMSFFSAETFVVWGSIAYEHGWRSEEHTSELQSLMRISYAVFCLKK